MAESASSSSSRLGVKSYHHQMGEIVEVQGGHIVRSTGRKDRHSKVCTAKGPRDRRVRLSAHTAIQFYDVQDRLGYDRPSKAVDWLIKKAKAAIDELDHLPAWNPAANSSPPPQPAPPKPDNPTPPPLQQQHQQQQSNSITASAAAAALTAPFLPPSLDSDSIADTIKSFFPIVSGGNNHNHHHHHDSGIHYNQQHQTRQNQDLRLSLQSLQDPIPMFHHHHHASSNDHAAAMFSAAAGSAAAEASSPLGFGWSDHRISFDGSSGGFGGFNSAAADNNSSSNNNSQLFFSTLQRGPLQSSNTTSVRANWIESQPLSIPDHHHQISQSMIHHHQQHQATSSMPAVGMGMGMGFGVTANSSSGGGGGFHYFPARIQGEEEHHHGGADKPSSASSDSRH